jgi:hypothetical protein
MPNLLYVSVKSTFPNTSISRSLGTKSIIMVLIRNISKLGYKATSNKSYSVKLWAHRIIKSRKAMSSFIREKLTKRSAAFKLMTCFGLNANSKLCRISPRHYKYLEKNKNKESCR